MQFTDQTPRRDITIQDVIFSVIQPYVGEPDSKGYLVDGRLSEGEAHTLNQTAAENFRNNFRDDVLLALEEGTVEKNGRASEALQQEMEKYMLEYEFGKRSGGVRTLDPVFAMMRDMARKIVKKRLKAKNEKLSDYDGEAIDKLAQDVIERHHDQLRAKAEAAVAQENALLSDLAAE